SPGIFREEIIVIGAEVGAERAERLLVAGVARNRDPFRDTTVGLVEIGEIVQQAAVRVSPVLEAQVLGVITDVIDVPTEFEGMVPLDPGHHISILLAGLVGISGALQEAGNAKSEAIGDHHLRWKSKRIGVARRRDQVGLLIRSRYLVV